MDAETTTTTTEQTTQQTAAEGQSDTSKESPAIPNAEELAAKLAEANAKIEKLKLQNDKSSSEAAEYKKQLRSKLTAEEQAAEAKAEAERLAEEEKENMRKELNHMKAVNAYTSRVSEKSIEKLIEAVSDNDHAAVASIFDSEVREAVNKAVAEKQAEWMKSRPPVNAGTGEQSTVTKSQFEKMSYRERVDFKEKNPELYKKYTE